MILRETIGVAEIVAKTITLVDAIIADGYLETYVTNMVIRLPAKTRLVKRINLADTLNFLMKLIARVYSRWGT